MVIADPQLKTIKLSTLFFLKIACRTKDRTAFADFVTTLKKKFSVNIPASKWLLHMLLESNISNHLFNEFLVCPVSDVRDMFIDLIMIATKTILVFEEPLVVESNPKEIKVTLWLIVNY